MTNVLHREIKNIIGLDHHNRGKHESRYGFDNIVKFETNRHI
jgi:hypothetical protein